MSSCVGGLVHVAAGLGAVEGGVQILIEGEQEHFGRMDVEDEDEELENNIAQDKPADVVQAKPANPLAALFVRLKK